MNKQEFLEELRQALEGEMSLGQIRSNLDYYNSYIEDEMSKGKSESQVLEALGSPRLIAKTLVDTSGGQQGAWVDYESGSYNRDEEDSRGQDFQRHRGFSISGFRARLILIGILVGVIAIIVLAAVFLISLLPYLIPILLIFLLFSFLFRSRR